MTMTDTIPVLFSAPMVQALLAGRKTQTRRLAWGEHFPVEECDYCIPKIRAMLEGHKISGEDDIGFRIVWPPSRWQKIKPGDRLWVRETWKPHSLYAHMKPRDMPHTKVFYKADDAYAPSITKWIPGIHMPRWASRLTLTVTATKIERLQEITDADAEAEGVEYETADPGFWYVPGITHSITAVGIEERLPNPAAASYLKLWNHLHGAGSADENPEVVAVTFAVEHNIDRIAA